MSYSRMTQSYVVLCYAMPRYVSLREAALSHAKPRPSYARVRYPKVMFRSLYHQTLT